MDPTATTSADDQQQQPQDPAPEGPPEEPTVEPAEPQPEATENPETSTPAIGPNLAQPAPSKAPRMLARLSNGLNGSNWTDPDFNIRPLRSRRRFVTAQIQVWNHDGPHEGSPDNTEPIPDDEPQISQEETEAPEQTNLSTGTTPGQKEP